MQPEYTLIGIPLGSASPVSEPRSFPLEIVSKLLFPAGEVTPTVVAAALSAHPLLTREAEKPMAAFAMDLALWERNSRRFDVAQAIPLNLRYAGAAPLTKLADTLRRYLLPPAAIRAGEMSHDARFDQLKTDHFIDVAKAHDDLSQLTQTLHTSALRSIGGLTTGSDATRATLSMDALRWISSAAHSAVLDGLRGGIEEVTSILSRLEVTERLSALRDAVGKINRRLVVDAARKPSEAEARTFRATTAAQTTTASADDPNVATHAALKNPLLARACGFVTSWRATADRPIQGDFVFYLPETSLAPAPTVTVSSKQTAFRRAHYTHPLAFPDRGRSATTNAALAFLNEDGGRGRYRASSVHTESALIKELVVQASNSIASPAESTDDRFGNFTGARDERPPQLLRDQQFGLSEPETSGVIFSAPVEDLVTPDPLRSTTPQERETAYPCLFLEDLWIGFRLDVKKEGARSFASVHQQTQEISFALSDTKVSAPTEDYFEREQADDPERGYSSTEFATYIGMTTPQARDYMKFLGIKTPQVVQPPGPFSMQVIDYEAAEPLLFGNVYRYRLRNVLVGGVGFDGAQADQAASPPNYEQRFPFFRARAYRPGEFVSLKAGEDKEHGGGGRPIFLTRQQSQAELTLVPAPIDPDTARFHGLLLHDLNEPQHQRRRKFVADLGKFFVSSGGRLDYYFDPDVRGVIVRARILNGAPEPAEGRFLFEDGAYCQLVEHLPLDPVELLFGDDDWESFRAIVLKFRTTDEAQASVSHGPHRLEIRIPSAAHLEVSLIPIVSSAQLVRTASYASSATQLARNPRLDIAPAFFTDWLPIPAMAEQRIQVIHATQRPLATPRLIGNRLGGNDASSSYQAIRPIGKEVAEIRGRVEVDAASTGQVRLQATWNDIDDDPSQAHYLSTPGAATTNPRNVVFTRYSPARANSRAFVSALVRTTAGAGTASTPLRVAVGTTSYRFVDLFRLQCAENKVFLGPPEGEEATTPAVSEVLNFRDARRKRATITATAISRFVQQFPGHPASDLESPSAAITVDVPASLRMSTPDVSHILPLTRTSTTNEGPDRIQRTVYAMRIYVRPRWFESGPGERLAIGCVVGDGPQGEVPSVDKRFTQWGEDPLERPRLQSTLRLPRAADFTAPAGASAPVLDDALYPPDSNNGRVDVIYRDNVSLSQNPEPGFNRPQRLSIASFALREDPAKRLWYCDVQVAGDFSGWCGLSLYRHQPHAHEGFELSAGADWVYAAILHGDVVAVVERAGNLHVTIGPIYDPYTTFEFEAFEYRDGVSDNLAAASGALRPMQRYRVNQATYFEGIVPRAATHRGLVKKRFGYRVGGLDLNPSQ